MSAPALEGGRYALVLFAVAPAVTQGFLAHGAATPLVAPTGGAFLPAVEPATALAGTLAGWLEIHTEPVALAPPLLYTDRGWPIADLGLDWPLPPHAPAAR